VLAAAAASAYYAVRVNTWAVMTDELQVARLAISIAQSGSPFPAIRGEHYGANSQLYPLLIAPFYGVLSATHAVAAAHVLNALLLASAAVPAFLLARSVTGRTDAGYAAAVLTTVTPWLVLSSTLLTENAAYPAFTWSVLLCQQALARPSPRRDLLALVGLALAFIARTQLVVVALALPLALVLHEIALAARRDRSPAAVRRATADAIRSHRVLVSVYAAGLVAATVLGAVGGLGGLVGNYALPFHGNPVPETASGMRRPPTSTRWRSGSAHCLSHCPCPGS
jgi:4-amino-4-deoxy-L-arabinose transferase-like glycosyltransferase